MPPFHRNARSDNRRVHLFCRKCCRVGKFGVLWGRKIMESHNVHHVIYRHNRTINRRQTPFVSTHRNAVRFCDGIWAECCVRIARRGRLYLSLARSNVRSTLDLIRAVSASRRRCDGIRTNSLFAIEASRNRQSRADTSPRNSARICGNRFTRSCDWRSRSPRAKKSRTMECIGRRKTFETSRNLKSCSQSKKWANKGNTMNYLFYKAKHGRLACEGLGIRDDASSLRLETAIRSWIVILGPRMVLQGKCARMEAKH